MRTSHGDGDPAPAARCWSRTNPATPTRPAGAPESRHSPIAGLTRARAERARYLCSCCRRLPADTAPMRGLGSSEGDRAAGLGLTIQIVAKHSCRIVGSCDPLAAVPITRPSASRRQSDRPRHACFRALRVPERRRPDARRDGNGGVRRFGGHQHDARPIDKSRSAESRRRSRELDLAAGRLEKRVATPRRGTRGSLRSTRRRFCDGAADFVRPGTLASSGGRRA